MWLFFAMWCVVFFSEDGVIDVFAFPGTPGSVHGDIDVESCSPVRGGSCELGVGSKFSGIVGHALIQEVFLSIRSSSSSLEVFPIRPEQADCAHQDEQGQRIQAVGAAVSSHRPPGSSGTVRQSCWISFASECERNVRKLLL